jgi:hypothetical protein
VIKPKTEDKVACGIEILSFFGGKAALISGTLVVFRVSDLPSPREKKNGFSPLAEVGGEIKPRVRDSLLQPQRPAASSIQRAKPRGLPRAFAKS